MKTLILILLLCSQVCGCLPLLAGGAIGYGVSQHHNEQDRRHQEFLDRERQRYERERWGRFGPHYYNHPGRY